MLCKLEQVILQEQKWSRPVPEFRILKLIVTVQDYLLNFDFKPQYFCEIKLRFLCKDCMSND